MARTGRYEAAREDLVANCLVDRVGLSGQQGLVDLQPGGRHDRPVDHHLVARFEYQEFVGHHLGDRHLAGGCLADYPGPGGREHGQGGQGASGP